MTTSGPEHVRAFAYPISRFPTTSPVGRGGSLASMTSHLHLATPDGALDGERLPITVVLADDHAMFRRTLRRLLDDEESLSVVDEASDLSSAIEYVQRHRPRVLVLDLDMPNGSTIEAIKQLRTEMPWTEIVVLTTEESALAAQQLLAAGAVAFVFKDRAEIELFQAVGRAAHGEEYVSPRVAGGLEVLRRAVDGGLLTPREVEVVRLIALGHTSAEIAVKLHLSRRTVETHRARIFQKLELRTRAELVRFALDRHLIGT
jgi:two-component system, NarL family, response regulator NreC